MMFNSDQDGKFHFVVFSDMDELKLVIQIEKQKAFLRWHFDIFRPVARLHCTDSRLIRIFS